MPFWAALLHPRDTHSRELVWSGIHFDQHLTKARREMTYSIPNLVALHQLADDVDDDYASLLFGLDVIIGIGDRGERIPEIDDGNESARLELVPQSGHERLPAAPLRQGNHDPPVSRDPDQTRNSRFCDHEPLSVTAKMPSDLSHRRQRRTPGLPTASSTKSKLGPSWSKASVV